MHQPHFTDTHSRLRYETMTKPQSSIVAIKPAATQKNVPKGQKQFNTLVKQIDDLKKRLREWQDFVPRYHQKVGGEYDALRHAYNAARLELAHAFDRAYADRHFSKKEKDKLKDAILTLVSTLMAEQPSEQASDELKALHDKYNDVSFDEQDQVVGGLMKSMLEAALGEKIGGDVDVSSPEKLQAYMEKRMAQEHAEAEQQRHEIEERRATRKKTAKQLQREEQQKAEELNLKKSIQDIYRKLVGLLHPDREPDSAERERKTELMRQLNVAYDKKDLLQMLELQLAVEKVDPLRAGSVSADRLKHYNKILKEQVDKIFYEIDEMEEMFRRRLRISPWDPISPKKVMTRLKADIKELRTALDSINEELQAMRDPANLKAWLKNYRIERQPDLSDLDDFLKSEFNF